FKRSYANGTIFADILSNKDGKVFEARFAEKRDDGTWDRYVAFKDVSARPSGYHGLTSKDCRTCHESTTDGPGTGGYALGLIPGGDTIISDPFQELERQGLLGIR